MRILILLLLLTMMPIMASAAQHLELTPSALEQKVKRGTCAKFIYIFTSWCSSCEKSFTEFMKLENQYGKPGMVGFIAISLDEETEELDAFIQKFKPDFPVHRLIFSNSKEALESLARIGVTYSGKVPHATFRDCDGSIFADGSFQYPYYNTVLQFWRDNYLE
jgi:thiol-disulfide isomerase/thioredoxin